MSEPSAPHLSSPSLCCSECHSLHGGGGTGSQLGSGAGALAQILVSKDWVQARDVAQWVEHFPNMHEALGVRPCAGLVAHVQNLTI